jgi:hypothetical protein
VLDLRDCIDRRASIQRLRVRILKSRH